MITLHSSSKNKAEKNDRPQPAEEREETVTRIVPKIVGISMVKNEQHIIEPFVRHNIRFLDHLIVLDNGSVDETRNILTKLSEEFANLVVSDDKEFESTQSKRMTALLHHCQAAGDHHFRIVGFSL